MRAALATEKPLRVHSAKAPSRLGVRAGELAHVFDFYGAARGTRTPDLLITNQLLYQLSYGGDGASPYASASGSPRALSCRRCRFADPFVGSETFVTPPFGKLR